MYQFVQLLRSPLMLLMPDIDFIINIAFIEGTKSFMMVHTSDECPKK